MQRAAGDPRDPHEPAAAHIDIGPPRPRPRVHTTAPTPACRCGTGPPEIAPGPAAACSWSCVGNANGSHCRHHTQRPHRHRCRGGGVDGWRPHWWRGRAGCSRRAGRGLGGRARSCKGHGRQRRLPETSAKRGEEGSNGSQESAAREEIKEKDIFVIWRGCNASSVLQHISPDLQCLLAKTSFFNGLWQKAHFNCVPWQNLPSCFRLGLASQLSQVPHNLALPT